MKRKLLIFYILISFVLLGLAFISNHIALGLSEAWPADVNNIYLIHAIITSIILIIALVLFITSLIVLKTNKKDN